jgi:hypothetical protein
VQGTLVWDAASGSQVTIPGTSVGADLNFTVDGLGAERRYEFQVAAYRGSVGTNAVFGAPSTVARATTTSAAPVVARIVVTPSGVALTTGDTATFRAQAQDASGTPIPGATITWWSTDASVLESSGQGRVRAAGAGTASIVARSGTVSGRQAVVVTAAAPVVARIVVTPSGVRMEEGETATFQAQARDASGTPIPGMTINWATSDGSVLALVGPGQVRAVGVGSANVVAWAGGVSGTQSVVVTRLESGDPGGTAFAVDWGTATGKSAAALTDGGKLGLVGYPADAQLTVVPLGGLGVSGWPTNGLQLSYLRATSSLVGTTNKWPAPAPGESVYFRFLVYHDMPNGMSISNDHGNQSNIGAIKHAIMLTNSWGESPSQNHWAIGFRAHDGGAEMGYYNAQIPERRPIRVEWRLHRQSSGVTARIEIRIYDETISRTVPQWTEFDFVDNYGAGRNSLGARAPVLDLGNEREGFRSYLMGISGSGPSTC